MRIPRADVHEACGLELAYSEHSVRVVFVVAVLSSHSGCLDLTETFQ